MGTLTLPWTFVNGTTADATQVDANFTAVAGSVNAIDNTNIGANGIYASQIIPTAPFQAEFGGTIGYSFNPGVANQVPLSIVGAPSQTADLFDVQNSALTRVAWIDNTGVVHGTYIATTPYGNTAFAAASYKWPASGGTGGMMASSGITINGVTATLCTFGISGGAAAIAIDQAGDIGANGNVNASGWVQAGSGGSIAGQSAGDGVFGRSTTTGLIGLGGSGSRAVFDWNITTANTLSCSTSFAVAGSKVTFSNVAGNGFTMVPSADGNLATMTITNAAQTKALLRFDNTDANNGNLYVTRGGNLANVLQAQTSAGAQISGNLHCLQGTATATGSVMNVSLTGTPGAGTAFTSSSSYMVICLDVSSTVTSVLIGVTNVSGTSFQIGSATSGHTLVWFAIGT